ncbi:ABC transporter substrate-binding protein [Bradyrhizobium liaoningense]|uniref:ABC transporter substrate-binding protein n=1 Tax=Bradyrhizobium liaoningense TaxID=43992 RepID=UPI001BA5765F|nr:ABC transporter substrate-binding protein [Bradyrhizobium liaoningense]MBR0845767.1 ABC transporter substrate-binding protein [Bradyrhizobium liaoningense]MBR0859933.1 ABC transporter substrate-binding protein [Bradyrhizobium liaoningense]
MSLSRRQILGGVGASVLSPAIIRAQGTRAIRIGEINSYSSAPAFTLPYRRGWQLAVEQLNAKGGLLGRELEVISRDDEGKPSVALRAAEELVRRHGVDLLAGAYLSNVGLAISDFARQNRILFVASEPLTDALVWDQGHRYCYRLRPSTYMLAAMLVEEAAQLKATRWATIAPNYEYGQSAVRWFMQLLSRRRPDVEFVGSQWPPLGAIDAGAVVNALAQQNPQAILNVTFGPDLARFVRQGNDRGLFKERNVVSFTTGEPEYLHPLGADGPEGWIVTGYPVTEILGDANNAFVSDYSSRYGEAPTMGSVVGHALISSIVAPIEKLGSLDTEAMADGFGSVSFDSPFGRATWRSIDHQSTLGTFVGRTTVRDNKAVMVDWKYQDGGAMLPPDTEVRRLRPAT